MPAIPRSIVRSPVVSKPLWKDPTQRKLVSCLGIRDPRTDQVFLFDATPDIKDQLQLLKGSDSYKLGGIFLTHGHMGHYTGLMHLGREAMNAASVPTYVMPRMDTFLRTNGPWSNLVAMKQIELRQLEENELLTLTPQNSLLL